jgi:hypothetical protein
LAVDILVSVPVALPLLSDYVCRPVDICSVKRPVVNQTVGEWSVGNVVAVPRRCGAEAVELLRGMELF